MRRLKGMIPGKLFGRLAAVFLMGALFSALSSGVLGGVPSAEALTSVSPGGPYTGSVGQAITFSGSAAGATAPTFLWTFGDGASAIGATVTHSYFSQGTFTVTLTVLDPSGTMGANTTATITAAGGFPFNNCFFFNCNSFFNGFNSGLNAGCYTQIFLNYNSCNSFQYPFSTYRYPFSSFQYPFSYQYPFYSSYSFGYPFYQRTVNPFCYSYSYLYYSYPFGSIC